MNLPFIPSLPNLVRQFRINQQGFDIDLAEHGRTVTVDCDFD